MHYRKGRLKAQGRGIGQSPQPGAPSGMRARPRHADGAPPGGQPGSPGCGRTGQGPQSAQAIRRSGAARGNGRPGLYKRRAIRAALPRGSPGAGTSGVASHQGQPPPPPGQRVAVAHVGPGPGPLMPGGSGPGSPPPTAVLKPRDESPGTGAGSGAPASPPGGGIRQGRGQVAGPRPGLRPRFGLASSPRAPSAPAFPAPAAGHALAHTGGTCCRDCSFISRMHRMQKIINFRS